MIRSFQWDLARQVERLDWLIAQFPRYADWGYQEVHLHLEDAVEYPSLPGVAREDAYTYRQFERLVAAATRAGIGVVPIVNLLGHTQYLIKVPELRDLNELRAPDGSALERGQICPVHPRTMEIAEKLLRDMRPFCTVGKVHVGLDESFHLGKHPLSRREIARIGLGRHFARYVSRLHALTSSLGLRMGVWADMLYFLPDAIPHLPSGITAYEWYYYPFKRRPRVELFNFAEADLATPLRERGIELYGCPMNGAFRFEPLPHFGDRLANIRSWWRYGQNVGATGFLVSSWEPYRLALELTTVIDAAAASLWLEPQVTEPREMLTRGFERVFGKRGARDAARLALASDKHAYSGYPRWEINSRWDVVSRREPVAPYRAEARHFARLARDARRAHVPAPLRASVGFRSYLAERDVFVRELGRIAGGVVAVGNDRRYRELTKRLGAAIRTAAGAAKTMWNHTRDPHVIGPNEKMVRDDSARLTAAARGEPVFGPPWQLCYRVWNFAPAVQLVAVQQEQADGTWTVQQSCHTIEFQAAAASPRAPIVRRHAAPVAWEGDVAQPPRLRIVARGVGQVRISEIELTDGRTVHSLRVARTLLGRPAPRSGWPDIDWNRNEDEVECILAPRRRKLKARPARSS